MILCRYLAAARKLGEMALKFSPKISGSLTYGATADQGATGVNAEHANTDMQMVRSVIYRGSAFDETNLRSVTFYNLSGTKGEERAWYSYNYEANGTTVKDTTIY